MNQTEAGKLNEWNVQIANRYIINDVLLVCYLLVGLFGNISVILIFKFKLKTNKDDRYFIPWLALFDLLACSFRSSFELVRKIQPLRLYGTVPCKAVWMIINMCSFSSMILLLVIAFHRYLKVCRPFGKQMTKLWKRISVFFTFILATVASVVLNFYNSEIRVTNLQLNVTGSTCDILIDRRMDAGFYVFVSFATIIVFLIILGLLVMYLLIGQTIYKQIQARKNRYSICRQNELHGSTDTSNKRCLKVSNKFSYMFMAITIGFCVSYIPQFIILFWEIKERKFFFDISKHNTAILSLIRELAIVNHFMNAFIYGYYDRKFREEIKKVFKCFKSINQQ